MLKSRLSGILRSLHLLHLTDYSRYLLIKTLHRKANKLFVKEHPDVILPPDYLIYESFQLDYRKYYSDSIQSSSELAERIKQHISNYNINILDWGCGPVY